MPDFFFLKKLNRMQRYAFAFFVKNASSSFASVLAPIAKSGLKIEQTALYFIQKLFIIRLYFSQK